MGGQSSLTEEIAITMEQMTMLRDWRIGRFGLKLLKAWKKTLLQLSYLLLFSGRKNGLGVPIICKNPTIWAFYSELYHDQYWTLVGERMNEEKTLANQWCWDQPSLLALLWIWSMLICFEVGNFWSASALHDHTSFYLQDFTCFTLF